MAKKLYVGNLPYTFHDGDLNELFSKFGEIQSAQIIVDRRTNRSKGFGFIEMQNEQEAQSAIDTLNGTDLDGRAITVNEARPPQNRNDQFSRNKRF